MSLVALIAWWSCNAFIPTVATGLAQDAATADGLDSAATRALVEEWKFRATYWFNMGGLIGTLLTISVAKILGRRALYGICFAASAVAIFATFGIDWEPTVRLYWYFAVGSIAAQGTDTVLQTLFYVGLVPALGLLLPWVVETRDKVLAD